MDSRRHQLPRTEVPRVFLRSLSSLTLQHYSAFHCPFFRPHLKFSRIEILRGNVEEAVRLNVRELEALQVRLRVLSQEVHSPVLNELAGCRSSTVGPTSRVR